MAKAKVIGTCRLCLAPNVELMESHIVPAWAYDRIRRQTALDPLSKNHNPVSVTEDTAVQISNEIKEHMLCTSCELRFSVNEGWFRQVTEPANHGALPPLSSLLNPNRTQIEHYSLARVGQLDVEQFVYFVLSVFWRAHECSKVSDFKLEPHVAEALRRYLSAGDPLPAALALTTYFYERMYVERPGLVSAFKTPVTVDGGYLFLDCVHDICARRDIGPC